MRRGVGRALFVHAENAARLSGATRLTTTADPHAEDFYRKMGLVTVGREDASLDGQPRFLPLMEKSLASCSGGP
jgi:GNAT superfamily N-acetyltransferase